MYKHWLPILALSSLLGTTLACDNFNRINPDTAHGPHIDGSTHSLAGPEVESGFSTSKPTTAKEEKKPPLSPEAQKRAQALSIMSAIRNTLQGIDSKQLCQDAQTRWSGNSRVTTSSGRHRKRYGVLHKQYTIPKAVGLKTEDEKKIKSFRSLLGGQQVKKLFRVLEDVMCTLANGTVNDKISIIKRKLLDASNMQDKRHTKDIIEKTRAILPLQGKVQRKSFGLFVHNSDDDVPAHKISKTQGEHLKAMLDALEQLLDIDLPD